MVLGEPPPELASLIERRRAGAGLYDDVWEEIRHLGPAPRPVHGYIDRTLAVLLAPAAATSRQIRLWRRTGEDSYSESDTSALLNVTASDLPARLDWIPA